MSWWSACRVVTGAVEVGGAVAAHPLFDLARTDYWSTRGDPEKRAGLREGYGQSLGPDQEAAIDIYALHHALALWNGSLERTVGIERCRRLPPTSNASPALREPTARRREPTAVTRDMPAARPCDLPKQRFQWAKRDKRRERMCAREQVATAVVHTTSDRIEGAGPILARSTM
jgi:hypothetical protein